MALLRVKALFCTSMQEVYCLKLIIFACAEVLTRGPSIVCIVESWLSVDIPDAEIWIEIIRLDRNQHGGGILLYIINSFSWEILLLGFK